MITPHGSNSPARGWPPYRTVRINLQRLATSSEQTSPAARESAHHARLSRAAGAGIQKQSTGIQNYRAGSDPVRLIQVPRDG